MRVRAILVILVFYGVIPESQECAAAAVAGAITIGGALIGAVKKLFAAEDMEPVARSLLNESNVGEHFKNYTVTNLDELAAAGLAAYKAAANHSSVVEKFRKAGHAILNHKLMSQHMEPENWQLEVEVPPAAHPNVAHDLNVISFVVPAGLRGIIEEDGRIRFECKEHGNRKCFSPNPSHANDHGHARKNHTMAY